MQSRRVVLTGLGVVAPNGADTETFWSNIMAGRSGVRRIESFDVTSLPTQIAGEVQDFDPAPYFRDPKVLKRTDRFAQFAMAAAHQALQNSGVDLAAINRDRFGVLIGTGIGGLGTMEKAARSLIEKGPGRVSPMAIIGMMGNAGSALVALEHDLRGPNMSIVTACATGSNSAGEAWHLIRNGKADLMLAGGCEATVTPLGLASFSAMKAMSTRNADPAGASRPFDRNRDGFVMGEGAGVVLLEELEHAKKRGANILCEMTGYGCTADAYHMTSPREDGLGVARAIRLALEESGTNTEEIDYLNAHATSTPIGDTCETRAIQTALGEQAGQIPISSTKSMTGHLLGAAGSVELAICALAIRDGVIPPTINLEEVDPECQELDLVPGQAREKKLVVVLNNSFGFGGHNTTIVLKKSK
jgi:3-oxoacyl-[acyl-carrier-protein] synthase II